MHKLSKMTKAELLDKVEVLEQRLAEFEAERIEFKQTEVEEFEGAGVGLAIVVTKTSRLDL